MMLAVTTLTHDALDSSYSPDALNENGALLRSMFHAHIANDDLALSRHLLSLGIG
jgi:hypothetical protein